MSALLRLDGAWGEGGGQILRTALTLSALTGLGFEIGRIRARRARPGLRPQHVAAARAVALSCGARVGGLFEGSPDLRFEPGLIAPGEFRFEIGTAGSITLVLQTVMPLLATAQEPSRVEVSGGTHVPASPSYHYLANHWAAAVARLGLHVSLTLRRAGFFPSGGGEVVAEGGGWTRPAAPLCWERRGKLLSVHGTSGSGRLKNNVAERQRRAAEERLWEERRITSAWEVVELHGSSPGSFVLLEAAFEEGRAAFSLLGERGVRAEVIGDRAARMLLGFLEREGAIDPHLADQLVVPLVLGGGGGRVTTTEVTPHLETVASVVSLFGIPAKTWGHLGGPGGFEVARS